MTVEHESKTGNDQRKYDLTALLGRAQRRSLDPHLPEMDEEERVDPDWETSESYWETCFGDPPRN